MKDLANKTVTELHALMAAGDTTPSEITKAVAVRIAEEEPVVEAYVTTLVDQADIQGYHLIDFGRVALNLHSQIAGVEARRKGTALNPTEQADEDRIPLLESACVLAETTQRKPHA